MSCKHGFSSEEWCSLCLGQKQTRPLSGPPKWWITHSQFTHRCRWHGKHPDARSDVQTAEHHLPHGTDNFKRHTDLPWRKRYYSNKKDSD